MPAKTSVSMHDTYQLPSTTLENRESALRTFEQRNTLSSVHLL
jgi:hypothetical protein